MPDEPHRIEGARPSSALVVALEHAARVELNRALADFVSSKHAAFYVHAGAALELEVKAELARINPLLILDPRSKSWDRDAKRILTGAPLAAGEGLRTIGAGDAVTRLDTIQPRASATLPAWSALVFHARNDVVHAGLVHSDDHDSHIDVASAFFQSILALTSGETGSRPRLGADPSDDESDFSIFGPSADLVRELVSGKRNAEKLAANRAVEQARQRYEAYEPDQRELLRAASQVRVNEEEDLLSLASTCIACGSVALAQGTLDAVDLPEGDNGALEETVILAYDRQACYVCGLRITSRQLSLLGQANAAVHPTATVEDVYGPEEFDPSDYEPDPNDYEREPDEYEPDPSDYEREPDDYERNPDDFEPDHYEPDDYERDPDDYEPDPSDYERDARDYG